jgi:hypothetical protein
MKVDFKQLLRGSQEFVKHEKRDSMYRVATYLISQFWGNTPDITDGLGVLLLTWNQAFYRYGSFDFDQLESFINQHWGEIERFRERDISSFGEQDSDIVEKLFNGLLGALQNPGGWRSPVAVSKALHLLAHKFFPLWDDNIAKVYGCYWYLGSQATSKYLEFMEKIKKLSADVIQSYINENGGNPETTTKSICEKCSQNLPFVKSLLKIIDEYNYAKHTKHWM